MRVTTEDCPRWSVGRKVQYLCSTRELWYRSCGEQTRGMAITSALESCRIATDSGRLVSARFEALGGGFSAHLHDRGPYI